MKKHKLKRLKGYENYSLYPGSLDPHTEEKGGLFFSPSLVLAKKRAVFSCQDFFVMLDDEVTTQHSLSLSGKINFHNNKIIPFYLRYEQINMNLQDGLFSVGILPKELFKITDTLHYAGDFISSFLLASDHIFTPVRASLRHSETQESQELLYFKYQDLLLTLAVEPRNNPVFETIPSFNVLIYEEDSLNCLITEEVSLTNEISSSVQKVINKLLSEMDDYLQQKEHHRLTAKKRTELKQTLSSQAEEVDKIIQEKFFHSSLSLHSSLALRCELNIDLNLFTKEEAENIIAKIKELVSLADKS